MQLYKKLYIYIYISACCLDSSLLTSLPGGGGEEKKRGRTEKGEEGVMKLWRQLVLLVSFRSVFMLHVFISESKRLNFGEISDELISSSGDGFINH